MCFVFFVLLVDFFFGYVVGKVLFDIRMCVYVVDLCYDVWFCCDVYFVLFLFVNLWVESDVGDCEVFVVDLGVVI